MNPIERDQWICMILGALIGGLVVFITMVYLGR